ncbi:EAL and HDOD domain-containing protein [Pseudokineococcus sp. 1T1Z-3]|uniref:EAL and HDOD domain-containing protein n=1 Tax=Pseudokineococcus sp. 1T1Z-3 TaxID=3132745 RepID=UPI003094DEA2
MADGSYLPLARQSVVDATGRRVGYELLFRGPGGALPGGEGWDLAAQDRATSSVIATAFGGVAADSLADGGLLFVNLTRTFLVGDAPLPLDPEGVVLEVLEDVPVDDLLLAGLARLRAQGYQLALDDYAGDDERLVLVPLVDVVKVDLAAVRARERTPAEVAHRCRELAPTVQLLAERVEDAADLAECALAGYTLFQGFWFDRPRVVEGVSLSPSQLVCVRLLGLLSDPRTDAAQVEHLVREDPALALRVLRWVGSAASGVRGEVTSVGQALTLMGPRTLSSWLVLAMLGEQAHHEVDDVVRVLTRARTCEMLAPHRGVADEHHTVGLLSAVAEVLGCDVSELVRSTGLSPATASALLAGEGSLGRLLAAVRAVEGDGLWPADALALDPGAVAAAHLRARASALRTARTLVGVSP